ncbi:MULTISPECIES: heme-copper oxidase subunit III [Dermacoccus]|uniref:cytochrome-c oxidase n=3 Tax=Dermacoccus TaxID=57495 RepID=A0A417Z1M9_9MICO|nr:MULTISPECIES: heme-copper oxidase subunit III [Dermacoccus]MBZ4498489.1 heme-copper oxidase subunit III [Dermacoccus sp. Tok2021]MBE7371877.1 heme-copper oxidase subunit III [Dermacoccus barathri]MCT1985557.1 heme-copper oxidase subunit III [Dermacoccus abyssi]QEH93035.1 heme-copper oxidase subunit III [Dermacoccus abyssi]RHW43901.1 heme-copper oxidase subunit III [Dermacoccus abyssi]
MATATTAQTSEHGIPAGHGPATRPNLTAVGTMVWLGSELMFFAGLFAMYFTIRSVAGDLWHDRTHHLNVTFAAINTTVLVISSVWCQLGVFKAEHGIPHRTGKLLEVGKWGMREWYSLTYLFGAIFVSGQVLEYSELHEAGISLDSDAYGSMFYITTGFHGIHVTLGLLAFLLIIGRTFTSKNYSHHQATGAIVTSYYWHFVDVVWIALFATIYLLK